MRRQRHRAGRDDSPHLVEPRRRPRTTDPHRSRVVPDVVRPRIDPWPLPDDSTLRPAQRRAVEVLVDLSTGSAGEKLAQRSACRVLDGIAEPLYDAPGWQVRIVASVTMQHGRALLSSPQQRSADDSVVVLARLLADIDAVAGHPYRPVFVHGCSPY